MTRPNDRNISMQHITTLLGAACCVCLATMLRHDVLQHVGCYWLKFEKGKRFDATFVVQFSTCNMLQHVTTW